MMRNQGFFGWVGGVGGADAAQSAERLRAMSRVHGEATAHFALCTPRAALGRWEADTTTVSFPDGLHVALAGAPRLTGAGPGRAAVARVLAQRYRDARLDGRNLSTLLVDLRGDFSLALVDETRSELLLATDRMGIWPVSHARAGTDGIVFGSLATAVDAHPAARSAIDRQAVYDYLFFHTVPSPQSIFSAQSKLEPAEYLVFGRTGAARGSYWRPRFANGSAGVDEAVLAQQLRATLDDAVRRRSGDPGTGAFLSGGIDSSTVTGLLGRDARTYSIGFDAAGYDEMRYARIAVDHFGATAREYYVTPADVVRSVPEIAAAYDEPFGNSSALAVLCCARTAARDGIRVLLAGDGGDELFGGNVRYAKQRVFEWYWRLPEVLRRGAIEPMLGAPAVRGVPVLGKAASYVQQARMPLPDRLQSYNWLVRFDRSEILEPDFLASVDARKPFEQMRESFAAPERASTVDRMLALDWKFTLADNDLRKVVRMCAAAGVRAQFPFLDDEVVELSTRLPGDWKVRGGELRWFFKRAMRGFLPEAIIRKPKHGFGLPFGVWAAQVPELRALAYDSLAGFRRRGYVRPRFIDKLIRLHAEEHAAYHGESIWLLMMLELWMQRHQPGAGSVGELQ